MNVKILGGSMNRLVLRGGGLEFWREGWSFVRERDGEGE